MPREVLGFFVSVNGRGTQVVYRTVQPAGRLLRSLPDLQAGSFHKGPEVLQQHAHVGEIAHPTSDVGQDSLQAPNPDAIPSTENPRDILRVLLYKGLPGVVLLEGDLGFDPEVAGTTPFVYQGLLR
jgi:hypothetical protein